MIECLNLNEKATQQTFAEIVGCDQSAISRLATRGILQSGGTYSQWLLDYCRYQAEGHAARGGDQESLTAARTREAEASAHLKELQIMEKAGKLIPIDMVQPGIEAMITAARTELLTLPDKVAIAIKATHGIDIDPSLVQDFVYESLNHLANTDLPEGFRNETE